MVEPISQSPSVEWFEAATQISTVFNQTQDLKISLNQVIPIIRRLVIFDNLVIYQKEQQGKQPLLIYARATGRGQSQGAEINWGEPFARKVLAAKKPIIEQTAGDREDADRLERPILLGIPMDPGSTSPSALIFIRFGSPHFDERQVQIACWVAEQINSLSNHLDLLKRLETYEEERKQLQFREDFVSTITHELRTPLGFIKGYATTLLRSDTQWDEKQRKEFLTIIAQETDKLQELIDNILDSARLQSRTMRIVFHKLRIEPVIRDVINRFETQHPGIQIDSQLTNDLPPIEGDHARLDQVISNLISNAIKYAPGAPILIKTCKRTAGISIMIRDGGPGIAPEELPHIFDRFYRGIDSHGKRGFGLGLFICKQIVRSHHGKISVKSSPHKGTRFIIQLPYKQAKKQDIP